MPEKRNKPSTESEVPLQASFTPTERFSFDMLNEIPRQHVIDTLELHAKLRLPPPHWAVERFGQQRTARTGGRPKKNALVDSIRTLAAIKCSAHSSGDKRYERASELLHSVPTELFCGLEVAASPSQIKKSYLAVVGRHRDELWRVNPEFLLRHYLPLLVEALDRRTKKPPVNSCLS